MIRFKLSKRGRKPKGKLSLVGERELRAMFPRSRRPSLAAIRYWRRQGWIPTHKIGRTPLFDPSEVRAALTKNKKATPMKNVNDELCIPLSALAKEGENGKLTQPKVGDKVTGLQLDGLVKEIVNPETGNESAIVVLTSANGVQIPHTAPGEVPLTGDEREYGELERMAKQLPPE